MLTVAPFWAYGSFLGRPLCLGFASRLELGVCLGPPVLCSFACGRRSLAEDLDKDVLGMWKMGIQVGK